MRKHPEPSRTRIDTRARNGDERIAAFRRILAEKQYAKIDGTMIDLFSASIVVQVYDALNEANRARFAALPAGRMALVAGDEMKRAAKRAGVDRIKFYRCNHWDLGPVRCPRPATGYLYAPDGQPCPGGAVCDEHGRAVVDEYREKLGERWTVRSEPPPA